MKRLPLIIFAFFLAACAPPPDIGSNPKSAGDVILVYHDDQRSVTCWIYEGDRAGGIFCMTDAEIRGKYIP